MTSFEPGDIRRAAAYLVHLATRDNTGMRVILEEAEQVDRMDALVHCVALLLMDANEGLYRSKVFVDSWRDMAALYSRHE